jgi:hypothetical protein
MNRNWIRSSIAMLLVASPMLMLAQEPPADVLKPADVLFRVPLTETLDEPVAGAFALAGDDLHWRAAEPTSPSDSLNNPGQAATATWTTQAPAPAARDGFEQRIARLEAQVAALSAQLRSGHAVAAAPRTTVTRTVDMSPMVRAVQVAPAAPTPPVAANYRIARSPVAPPAAMATAAPGAPIVIHIYLHPTPAPAAATPSVFYYHATPAIAPPAAATADPTRGRVRVAPPATGAPPTIFSVPLSPAIPPTPATPATPVAPTSTTEGPALAPISRIAWDDIPGEELAGERQP